MPPRMQKTMSIRTLSDLSARECLLGVAMALLILSGPVLVLVYGLVGIAGNSLFTGSYIASCLIGALLLTLKVARAPFLNVADGLFATFAIVVVCSLAVNGSKAATKEVVFLAASLSAYACTRMMTATDLGALRTGCLWTAGVIALLGTLFTAPALIEQWEHSHRPRPFVFGFDHAATVFAQALAVWLVAATCSREVTERVRQITFATIIPAMVFAASMVRLTLAATAAVLLVVLCLTRSRKAKVAVVIISGTFVLAVGCGAVLRTEKFRSFILEQNTGGVLLSELPSKAISPDGSPPEAISSALPSCQAPVNLNNSLAVRIAVWQDALYLLRQADLFGRGLDFVASTSCMKISPHNAALQALAEFGWLGGGAFLLLMAYPFVRLSGAARDNDGLRFLLCCFAFVVVINMFHGRLSRQVEMFALAGALVGVASGRGTRLVDGKPSVEGLQGRASNVVMRAQAEVGATAR